MIMKVNNHDSGKRDFIKKAMALSAGLVYCKCYGLDFLIENNTSQTFRKIADYQEETPRGIMCLICPNECVLKEGELSKCNNRKVRSNKLYTLAFGNPCSVNIDPVEKKPMYHFLPGEKAYSIATAGCNLVCLNCQNWTISQTSPDKTRNFDLMPDQVVKECISNNCKSIAYTYSEPITFFEYTFETATLAKNAGIKNIVKSNGYINRKPLEKLCTVTDGFNIDLKSFNESTYLKLTGGKLQPVLDSLLTIKESGKWLEITNLIIPSWTDNYGEIRTMCQWLSKNGFTDTPIHFSRFYPLHKLEQLSPTPVENLNSAAKFASDEGLKFVYTGNVPGKEISDTTCPGCKRTLIKREGFRVTMNTIVSGKCFNCGTKIEGVWS
jgi:pyruvate formate lyase activating enzyme